ncbi:hypothetical protein HK405_011578, partial [Cladochytrium tenue]
TFLRGGSSSFGHRTFENKQRYALRHGYALVDATDLPGFVEEYERETTTGAAPFPRFNFRIPPP